MSRNYFDGGVPTQTFRKNAIKKNENGSYSVTGVRIFRTGKFRDSKGKKHDIGASDLSAMVDNFDTLRTNGQFTDVPVRKDHSASIEKVMGYFSDLRTTQEGDTHFLEADFDSLTEEDLNKLVMGLYRNVSAEIGVFPANDDQMYFPAVMGVAYVDIPAVSGLFTAAVAPDFEFSFGTNSSSEGDCSDNQLTFTGNPVDFVEGLVASHPEITYFSRSKESTVTTENDDQKFTFRIQGQETQDFGKVQAYIAQVEGENDALLTQVDQYAKERVEAAAQQRANFVKGLSEGDAPKISAKQVEALQEMVKPMDDAQFASFQKAYEDAPALRQFASHGNGSNHDGADGRDEFNNQLSIAREKVSTLRRSGMPEAKIQETASFRKLTELEAQQG